MHFEHLIQIQIIAIDSVKFMMFRCKDCHKQILPQTIQVVLFVNLAKRIKVSYFSSNTHSAEKISCTTVKSIIPLNSEPREIIWAQEFASLPLQNLKTLKFFTSLYKSQYKICPKFFQVLAQKKWSNLQSLSVFADTLNNYQLQLITQIGQSYTKFEASSRKIFKNCDLQIPLGKWVKLQCLRLSKCQISQRGVKSLIRAQLKYLSKLDLNFCGINDEELIQLSKGQWPRLLDFDIKCGQEQIWTLSNRGLKLFRFGNWPQLNGLDIDFSVYSLESLRICACSNLKRLKYLIHDSNGGEYAFQNKEINRLQARNMLI